MIDQFWPMLEPDRHTQQNRKIQPAASTKCAKICQSKSASKSYHVETRFTIADTASVNSDARAPMLMLANGVLCPTDLLQPVIKSASASQNFLRQ